MRQPLHSILLLQAAVLLEVMACTLTSEPFNPKEFADEPLRPADDDEGSAAAGGTGGESGAGMCTSSELAGCPLPLAAVGGDCSSDLDCESAVCVSGACALASCSDGRSNGGEAGIDCGGPCSSSCGGCEGPDCVSPSCSGGLCPSATCDDGARNQGEADIDCGGPCEQRCGLGQSCSEDDDCGAELFCPEASRECANVSCGDGALNGSELAIDCGGGTCPGCPLGAPCVESSDCRDLVCDPSGACAAGRCDDGVRNQDETGRDCGGSCNACPDSDACSDAADCQSGVCGAGGCDADVELCCQTPTCTDTVRNGGEPSIDCGNAACGLCPLGRPCGANAECGSGSCQAGICRVHPCLDGAQNGAETDLDCGGTDPRCRRCGAGADCQIDSDCASGDCAGGVCVSCDDGQLNGSETGVDCGGVCGSCAGVNCGNDNDCASGACEAGTCCGGELADCTRCARRLATGINCESNGTGANNDCNAFLQCLADNLEACETSTASECSDDPDDICFYDSFGGEAGPGVTLAEAILDDAGCQL